MKRLTAVILFASAFAYLAADQVQAGFLDADTEGVRADLVYYDSSDDGIGLEVGYGVALYELDDVGLVYGYAEDDHNNRLRSLKFYAEEHYLTHTPLVPFIGVMAGHAWYDSIVSEAADEDAWIAGVRVGAKMVLHDALAFSASLEYAVSIDDNAVFLDNTGASDNATSLSLGVRWYF